MHATSTFLSIAATVTVATAQICVSLKGSTACPGFQTAYISTSLADSNPFFKYVSNLTSFDDQIKNYVVTQYVRTHIAGDLQCSGFNPQTDYFRYTLSVLCSRFIHDQASMQCSQKNNGTPMKLCGQTCLTFTQSISSYANNSITCPPTINVQRNLIIGADNTTCMSSSVPNGNGSLTGPNACVNGQQNGEGCGFGNNRTGLCNYCDPVKSTSDTCCKVENLSRCNYTLSQTSSLSSTSSTSSTSTGIMNFSTSTGISIGSNGSQSESGRLSGGAIAGIVVGCVIGGLLLLVCIIFFLIRQRNSQTTVLGKKYQPNEKSIFSTNDDVGRGNTIAFPTSSSSKKKYRMSIASNISESAAIFGGAAATTATALGGRDSPDDPAQVPYFQDQYSPYAITPGSEVVAVYPYERNLDDELGMKTGDIVQILKIFDDGWGIGNIVGSMNNPNDPHESPVSRRISNLYSEGAFPMVCVMSKQGYQEALATSHSQSPSNSNSDSRSRSASTAAHSATDVFETATESEGNLQDNRSLSLHNDDGNNTDSSAPRAALSIGLSNKPGQRTSSIIMRK